MIANRSILLVSLALLAPAPLLAAGPSSAPSLAQTQSDLQKAQAQKATHQQAASAAQAKAIADAATAAALAQSEIASAARLRTLEDQTGGAADAYASLQARQIQATAALTRNEVDLAQLMPVMQRLSVEPAATLLAAPGPAANTVRGLMIIQGIAAAIRHAAAAVQAESQTVSSLLDQMSTQQKTLFAAVAAQQQAENTLTQQIAAAQAAQTADSNLAASETAAAIAADAHVRSLADIIAKLSSPPHATPAADAAGGGAADAAGAGLAPGNAPVAGHIIQAFGAATIAGPATGITYRTTPGARVTAPCAGGVQFANHFQSYGELVIIDCGASHLFVLSGMDRLDVSAGQNVARGQPVGEMAAFNPASPGAAPQLYVELRQNGTPINPTAK